MAGYNKVILLGNLTRDPQLRYLPSNTPVCEFGLAVNRRWRDRDGNMQDEVCFVDLSAFGRSAETINQYMSKGRMLMVDGRLKFDSWTAQDGSKRSKLRVVVENFQFVGGRGGDDGGGRPDRGGGQRPTRASADNEREFDASEDATSDDIPF
jgi:single-strand DNA-binding protein